MPTVIDSLIIELGLDPTKFTTGQKAAVESFKKTRDEATDTAKRLEEGGKRAAGFYGELAKGAQTLFAVVLGADVTKFAQTQVNSLAGLGRAASLLGAAVGDVDAFSKAVERAGGSKAGAIGSMQSLQMMSANAKFGQVNTDQLQALGFIGASYSETPIQIIKKYADWAKRQKDAGLVLREGTALGLDPDTINFAKTRGGAGIATDMKKVPTLSENETNRAQHILALERQFMQTLTTDLDKLGLGSKEAAIGVGALVLALNGFGVLKGIGLLKGVASVARAGAGAAGVAEVAAEGASAVGAGLLGAVPLGILGAMFPTKLAAGTLPGASARAAAAYARRGGGGKGAPASAGSGGGHGAIYDFLKSHGVSDAAAAGIAAGIMAESRGNPNAFNSKGGGQGAYGIGQWRAERLAKLRQMFASDGKNVTLQHQLEYLLWEMTNVASGENVHGKRILAEKSPILALNDYVFDYMRPGKIGAARDMQRGARALTTISIENLNVNAPHVKDVARATASGLRSAIAQSANTGLN